MISIVISEKGGAERRDVFDQDEITFGRVKGNDVLLPKGNVSKQHARLIVRDGRYIVTDLKSTNGTYVNHRRITHATLVREGDRIYIGDYIVRIETGAVGAPLEVPPAAPSDVAPGLDDERLSVLDPAITSSFGAQQSMAPPLTGSLARLASSSDRPVEDAVSHFPLEQDPDLDDAPPPFDLPGPPRLPRSMDEPAASEVSSSGAADSPSSAGTTGPHPVAGMPTPSDPTPSARTSREAVEEGRRGWRRDRVSGLASKVEATIGSALLDALPRPSDDTIAKVDAALAAHASEFAGASEFDPASTVAAARRELVGLGPLELLLADDQLTRIRVAQREVQLLRRGQPAAFDGVGFTSEASVLRTLRRLAADAGATLEPGQTLVELDLGEGRTLQGLLPPAALDGAVVQIRRLHKEPVTLNVLVRGGAISRGMASLLANAVAARANFLVVGGAEQGVEEMVGSLCLAAPRHHQVLAIGDDDFGGRAVRLASRTEGGRLTDLVRATTRLLPDHILSRPLAGEPLAAMLDAIAEGQAGVVLASATTSVRQALERMASDLAATRRLPIETAREQVGSSFDLALEVSRLRDGRVRVVRVAELKGATPRDVFTFHFERAAAGGAMEGTFVASGVIPRIVEDLALRGIPLDTAIFRRHPTS